jgi:chemotaxis protein MotB
VSAGASRGTKGPGRRRGAAEEHEEEPENAERWLLSYADMITLLMALFIVLFAISQVDQQKLIALSSGLDQYFGEPAAHTSSTGILDGAPQSAPDGRAVAPQPTRTESALVLPRPASAQEPAPDSRVQGTDQSARSGQEQRDDLTAIRDRIAASLRAKGLAGSVVFEVRDHGLVVNVVTDRVLFEAGEATLRPEGRRVLDAIAPTLKVLPNQLTVEGHTDNRPISGRFASNWELSTERATTVLRYVLTRGVAGSRVSAAGYADQRPLSSNATDAGRARNRRVAIVVHALAAPEVVSSSQALSSTTPGD